MEDVDVDSGMSEEEMKKWEEVADAQAELSHRLANTNVSYKKAWRMLSGWLERELHYMEDSVSKGSLNEEAKSRVFGKISQIYFTFSEMERLEKIVDDHHVCDDCPLLG